MSKKLNQNLEKTPKKKLINGKLWKIIKSSIWALATTLALQQPVNADNLNLINPSNPINLLKSPVYLFLPRNIWNDDNLKKIEKDPKTKKFFNESLKLIEKNTGIKDNTKLRNINFDIIKLFIFAHNKKLNWEQFLLKFLDLGKKYNIEETKIIILFSDYIKKWFIPEYARKSLKKQLGITYRWLLNFYGTKEFTQKLKKAEELYHKQWTLTKQDIKEIFKDYIKHTERIKNTLKILFLITIFSLMWVIIYTIKEINNIT